MKTLFTWLPGLVAAALLPAAVQAGEARPGGLPEGVDPGALEVVQIGGEKPDEALRLPLQHTDVVIDVSGFVARTTVTQHYTNPFDAPIEAVYTFPLPHDAAVDDMTMHVGDAVIRGVIKRREEAREAYEQAKRAGKRASLLEQERPNIFTQSVGNIMPGDDIRIEIRYVDILDYRDDGAFELVFPMVVGPRYIPGQPQDAPSGGSGWAPDTDQVPDASRITPPVLKPGERSGHDIALRVDLDAALPIRGLHSVSHAVDIDTRSDSERDIRLHPSDRIPNKDFVLRYQVAGEAPEMALIPYHTEEKGGYFTLIVLPQQEVSDAATVPRDLIFVLDTSGSMRGQPLARSREAMTRLIAGMRPNDRFNIVRFAGDTGTLWSEPRPATRANRRQAERFVESLRGAGGTEMRRGIVEALAQPADPERMRIAFLLTDGYVGNEAGIIAAIEKERRGARVFTLGVGSSVNRYLLDRAASVGLGEAFYVRQDEPSEAVIERFFKRVDRPALAHVTIDWDGLDVQDLTPERIPDLWQGQPIEVHGRYRKGGQGTLTIRGRLGSQPYVKRLPVVLPEDHPEDAVMASVWARARVKELMTDMARHGQDEEGVERITKLGLDYRIMTQWTSFVAVQEKVVNVDGEMRTVVQPVELPEGVDYEGVFGPAEEASVARRMAVPAAPAGRGSALSSFGGRMLRERALPMAPPPPSPAPAREAEEDQAKASVADRADVAAETCRYTDLSVSGGLRYLQAKTRLDQAWPSLCAELARTSAPLPDAAVEVTLRVDASGQVHAVTLSTPRPLPRDLEKALREHLQGLSLAPTAGRATVTLRLLLGARAASS